MLLVSGPQAGHDKLRAEAGLASYRYLTAADLEDGYRRSACPLTFVIFLVVLFVLPVVWPLR